MINFVLVVVFVECHSSLFFFAVLCTSVSISSLTFYWSSRAYHIFPRKCLTSSILSPICALSSIRSYLSKLGHITSLFWFSTLRSWNISPQILKLINITDLLVSLLARDCVWYHMIFKPCPIFSINFLFFSLSLRRHFWRLLLYIYLLRQSVLSPGLIVTG